MSDDLDDLLHDLDMIDGLGDNKGKGNNVKLNHHSVGSSSGAGGSNMFPRPPVEKKSPQVSSWYFSVCIEPFLSGIAVVVVVVVVCAGKPTWWSFWRPFVEFKL